MSGTFIPLDDPRWTDALRSLPHDVYHTPGYLRASAGQEGGTPVAYHARQGGAALFAPLLVRDLPPELGAPGTWRDATTPYGYAAPLLTPGADPGDVRRLLSGFVDAARERGIVSVFFRLNPLLELPLDALEGFGALREHGPTVPVDLRPPLERVLGEMRENHAVQIRRMGRAGFAAEWDRWETLDRFAELYHETMARVGADASYFFPPGYFHALRRELDGALHLCGVRGPEGDLACAGLFAAHDGIVQYFFSGTAGEHARRAPTKLMMEQVIRWGSATGQRVLHLGGGVGGREDALFHFKAGFSDDRRTFVSWRVVVDGERYAALAERRGGDAEADAGGGAGFFPAYRAPAADAAAETPPAP